MDTDTEKISVALVLLVLLIGGALGATDLSINNALGNATNAVGVVVGSTVLVGIIAAIAVAYVAWRRQVSLPAIFIAATLALAYMQQYHWISTEWVYAALILGGILGGVGIARWLGLI